MRNALDLSQYKIFLVYVCVQWWAYSEWTIYGVAITQRTSRLLWSDP